jgi:hypothetical protein
MLAKTQDEEQIIARVAALDIGKTELVCCARVPDEDRPGRRLQVINGHPSASGEGAWPGRYGPPWSGRRSPSRGYPTPTPWRPTRLVPRASKMGRSPSRVVGL